MKKQIELVLSPKEAFEKETYEAIVAKELQTTKDRINELQIIKKSIDARSSNIKVHLTISVVVDEPNYKQEEPHFEYSDVSKSKEAIIVGAGPAGLFAALRLIENNIKPIIFERGKDVGTRKIDIANICKESVINPESNYCFGEGGAGTFSDGKLYTRSKKRGDYNRILQIFRFHGADESILYEAYPHIGTNKLPGIIKRMRQTILNAGGEVHFDSKITNLLIKNSEIEGVEINNAEKRYAKAIILATGHSARDIYELLHANNVKIEPKGFAMGLRVEHPQEIIDSIQYHLKGQTNEFLPAASYNIVKQIEGRGVYSFCMCPGGFIVPAATGTNQIVTNGMSPAARNSPFANSGIVVEIQPEDFKDFNEYGALAGLKYQQMLEEMAFNNGGRGQVAPAQRLHDFVNNKISPTLPETSYIPGVTSSPIHFWMPDTIGMRLKKAFESFGQTMRGYLTNEAIVVGVESRTSSPIKIPRDTETMEHIQIKGLFPCGEGAGYAGGIVSSAMDGEKCADMLAVKIK